ncbi:MAG: Do family serine endopeptidase [Abditibacteriaceae bacterium]
MNDKRKNKNNVRAMIAASVVVVALGAGYMFGTHVEAQTEIPKAVSAPVVETPATKAAVSIQDAFGAVSDAVEPAVVTITTETTIKTPTAQPGDPGSDPFEDFFKQFRNFGFGQNSYQGKAAPKYSFRKVQTQHGGGLGSGMIIKSDGLILTNAHVVNGADKVSVKLADGRDFQNAKVVGEDKFTDVALVKINATDLPTVKFGDSDNVKVGDWAIAIGNPFGLEHSVTVGVISAKAREVPLSQRNYGGYLQTDASINPGNSGGPLCDIYGRVIGINNAIYSESGGNIGIGFAIPINSARKIADELLKSGGHIKRGYLGVTISDLKDRGAAFGLDPNIKGVLVEQVMPNTPGAKAGLQPGDVITEFNGKKVSQSTELQNVVGSTPVGTKVNLTILRNGKPMILSIVLAELPDSIATSPGDNNMPGNEPPASNNDKLGLSVRPLTPDLAQRFGIKSNSGVLIVGVKSNSPADNAGLKQGDVVERVGQTPVATPEQLAAAVKSILDKQHGDKKSVALYITSRGVSRYVTVDMNPQ